MIQTAFTLCGNGKTYLAKNTQTFTNSTKQSGGAMYRKSSLTDRDLANTVLVTTVYTKNGEETRPIENLARLVNYRGFPEYVREPQLRPGEELFRTRSGDCIIVEAQDDCCAIVVGVDYEWEYQQVKRTLTYSDGRTSVSYQDKMPTREEYQLEIEMYKARSKCQ